MRKIGLFLILLATVAIGADAVRSAPLLLMRRERQGYENLFWMEQRVKIGKQAVMGYIQGTGGAEDAIIGYLFEEDWDMLVVTIGFLNTTPEGREAEFFVEADGEMVFSSGIINSKSDAQEVRIPIRGHKRVLLRISSDKYNGTAGAAWGAPTLLDGLTEEEMKNDWNVSINGKKTPVPGKAAPQQVLVPFDVPAAEEVQYRVKIRRDTKGQTVIVEHEREDS